jgi:hypothetical protein
MPFDADKDQQKPVGKSEPSDTKQVLKSEPCDDEASTSEAGTSGVKKETVDDIKPQNVRENPVDPKSVKVFEDADKFREHFEGAVRKENKTFPETADPKTQCRIKSCKYVKHTTEPKKICEFHQKVARRCLPLVNGRRCPEELEEPDGSKVRCHRKAGTTIKTCNTCSKQKEGSDLNKSFRNLALAQEPRTEPIKPFEIKYESKTIFLPLFDEIVTILQILKMLGYEIE